MDTDPWRPHSTEPARVCLCVKLVLSYCCSETLGKGSPLPPRTSIGAVGLGGVPVSLGSKAVSPEQVLGCFYLECITVTSSCILEVLRKFCGIMGQRQARSLSRSSVLWPLRRMAVSIHFSSSNFHTLQSHHHD